MSTLVLQNIGAVLALMVGLNGLFRPLHMGKLVGLAPETKVGLIEIRVLFGCFLTTLPLILLYQTGCAVLHFFRLCRPRSRHHKIRIYRDRSMSD